MTDDPPKYDKVVELHERRKGDDAPPSQPGAETVGDALTRINGNLQAIGENMDRRMKGKTMDPATVELRQTVTALTELVVAIRVMLGQRID